MKAFSRILVLLLSLVLAASFVLFSFAFGSSGAEVFRTKKVNDITSYAVSLAKDENGVVSLKKTLVDSEKKKPVSFANGKVGYVEFGRLASVFLLPDTKNTITFSDISLSGKTLIFPENYGGIVSLYDPFTSYKILSSTSEFAIEQMTNGSFYIGRESDGTISIYSIDAVGRLEFLSSGKVMTDMVLFPGMYIRFDPKLNSTLQGADLFRIMLSMVPDGTKNDINNTTGIEFVNPRMNDTEDKDVFFMYRLPLSTRILFRSLHVLFHDRVAKVDLYRDYGNTDYGFSDAVDNPWLLNPSKKNHFLLSDLDSILSDALKPNSSLNRERFVAKLSEIHKNSQSLALGNSVQTTLEQFLTDGRFALFGGTKINQNFADIYNAVSEVVGIAPLDTKTKLFEKLADIYSRNLVTQKKDFSFSKIDTYTPTSLELAKTLNSTDIEHKDYFDIALYAFYVLSKAEEKGLILPEALYAHPTYELLSTIFLATDLYVRSIGENEKKITTYKSISLQFYDKVFATLAGSLYTTFMTNQDGMLFLKENFVDSTEGKIKFDNALITDFRSFSRIADTVFTNLSAVYAGDTSNPVYLSIKRSLLRIRGFVALFDDGNYSQYILHPYIADGKGDVLLPKVSPNADVLLQVEKVDSQGNTEIPSETSQLSSTLSVLQKVIPSVTQNDLIPDGRGFRVNQFAYRVTNPSSREVSDVNISFALSDDGESLTNLLFSLGERSVAIVSSDTTLATFQASLGRIGAYKDALEGLLAQNPNLTGDIRILESSRKIVIGNYVFDF